MLAILIVNNPTDTAISGQLSLREAVAEANLDAAAGTDDEITFDASLGGQTIALGQGQLEISSAGGGTITIDGSTPDLDLAINGSYGNRVFSIDAGVHAVVKNLALESAYLDADSGGAIFNAGNLSVSGVTLTDNSATSGGAIENQGQLTLDNDLFSGNTANSGSGGAIDNSGGSVTARDTTFHNNAASFGGALYNENGGTLNLFDCAFTQNNAYNTGGAINNFSSTLTDSGSFFTNNAADFGGAVENYTASASFSSTTFSGNTSDHLGAAIDSFQSSLALNSATISGNRAGDSGGGINIISGTATIANSTLAGNTTYNSGGGIENNAGDLMLAQSTLTGNTASFTGGAVDNQTGLLSVTSTTISANTSFGNGGGIENNAGNLTVQNSIISANNSYASVPDIDGSITTDSGNNLLGTTLSNNTSIPAPGPGDIFSDAPGLATLGDYGGSTLTMPPAAGSATIGAGSTAAELMATDQRGLPRTTSGRVDIGAVQTQSPQLAFIAQSQTFQAGEAATFTIALEDLDGIQTAAGVGGVPVSLASSSPGGTFLDAGGNLLGNSILTIPQGASSATFQYRDTQAGTATLSVSAAGFGPAAEQESILPAAIAATPDTTIIVGRTLSAYFTADVQNNQETITFTVYNESADSESGVLLTDGLVSGVTLVSASQQPDQSGQDLAWSLGTIQGFDRATVTITVSLANGSLVQIDTGAQAFAMLDAGAVSNSAPPAILRAGSADANLLASTPDANSNDPFIQEEAAALYYNPQNIFNFLHNDVGYNSYAGSLRGARGTLWSDAGNALDVASLGVALMRASGIPAQYVAGTLSYQQAQPLILSMFPAQYQTVGNIPAGTQTSDPVNDGQLLNETESHYWLQFDAGAGMQAADPLMAGAAIGQTFTAATSTFSEVPDNLRQQTEIKVTAEIWSQAAAALSLGGNGLSENVVLDLTFNDVDLVGRPLTFGNFVSSTTLPALVVTATTNTYSPYLQLGDEAFPDPSQDEVIRGTDYQEVLTNFPLGNQVLTGLFLNIQLTGPGLSTEGYDRTLFDRIGFAARQGLQPASITPPADGAPALTDEDIVTLMAPAGVTDASADGAWPLLLEHTAQALNVAAQTYSSSDQSLAGESGLAREFIISMTRDIAGQFLALSNATTSDTAKRARVLAYDDAPRLIIVTSHFSPAARAGTSISYAIDLRRDEVRTIAYPGQAAAAAMVLNVVRGTAESIAETNTLAFIVPGNSSQIVSATTVFAAADAQHIPSIMLTPDDVTTVSSLTISAEAQARISFALGQGKAVLVPSRSVLVNDRPAIAWYEIDPNTGDTIGVTEDGGHAALTESGFVLAGLAYFSVVAGTLAFLWIGSEIAFGHNPTQTIPAALGNVFGTIAKALQKLASDEAKAFPGQMDNLKNRALDQWNTLNAGPSTPHHRSGANASAAPVPAPKDASIPATPFAAPAIAAFGATADDILNLFAYGPLGLGPVLDLLNGAEVATATSVQSAVPALASLQSGPAASNLLVSQLEVSGQLSASWNASAGAVESLALNIGSGTILDQNAAVIGAGAISAVTSSGLPLLLSGLTHYEVQGTGSLSSFGAAEVELGVSGDWQDYTATVTSGTASGSATITLTVPDGVLTLNGQPLPAGTYTITTNSATISGSGTTPAPNFAGTASITATGGTVVLGPGAGSISSGGQTLDPTRGTTLDGYSGTLSVTANGDGTDNVALSGSSTSVLQLVSDPPNLTTDENTPITFSAGVKTSLADTYNLTATGPQGWAVAIDAQGNVTVTPAPGLQGGTYPIQIIAQSQANPNLIAQNMVNVTITPTAPGMSLAVNPDSLITVPYNGAEVPTAFRAAIHNTGPAADTYSLTISNLPSGFTLLNSGTEDTVPAGATGILGVYLQPTGTLPTPGTQLSFTVTATSTNNPAITQTVTESFTMPVVQAITASSDPTALSATPGETVAASVTLTNVGNVAETIAVGTTLSSGLTVSGISTPVTLAIGQSTTQSLSLTAGAQVPLNSTLNAAINYEPAATQSVVSVVNVNAGGSFAEAGAQIPVTADVLAGVMQPEQGQATFVIDDSGGQAIYTSAPVSISLGVTTALSTISLGSLDTTGYAPGTYTIHVTISDAGGTPFAGASGIGTLTIGSPISVAQSVDSTGLTEGTTLTAGTGTVTSTLTISREDVIGSITTTSSATDVAVAGSLAYVAGSGGIDIVDITNPASPAVKSTFATAQIAPGSATFLRVDTIAGTDYLVVATGPTAGAGASGFNLLIYSLASPSSPALESTTAVPYGFVQGLITQGSTAVIPTSANAYSQFGFAAQFGNVITIDLSNPAAPQIGAPLFGASDANAKTAQFGAVAVTSGIAYVASSTATGGSTQNGVGRVLIVNDANPSVPTYSELDIPGTFQVVSIAIQGTRALVVGRSGGTSDAGVNGTITLSVLDVTNPQSPTLLGTTLTTNDQFDTDSAGGVSVSVAPLGNGRFAVSGVLDNSVPAITIVDASDPANIVVNGLGVTAKVGHLAADGDVLYATSAAGLSEYRISALTGAQVTATIVVPTADGVTVAPGSFNIPPTQTIIGANSETLVWHLSLAADQASQQITWQTTVSNLQADEVRQIASTVTVAATLAGGTETVSLAPLAVVSVPPVQSLSIPVNVVVPGAQALMNAAQVAAQTGKTDLANRFNDLAIALANLVEDPTNLVPLRQAQAALTSIAGQSGADPLLSPFAPALTAAGTSLAIAVTPADIDNAVINLGTALDSLAQAIADEAAHGFTLALTTSSAEIQPGGPSVFTLSILNTGSQTTTYDFSIAGLPAGATFAFNHSSLTLAPGQTEADTTITLSISESGNTLVPADFTVTATAEGAAEITQGTPGHLLLRAESLSVAAVVPSPPFTTAGGQVDVTAKIQTVVNESRQLAISYTVADSSGNVLFTSTAVSLSVGVSTQLTSVDLGTLDTTGFVDGYDTIAVTAVDQSPQPLSTATGAGSLQIGLPVSASLSVSPGIVPTGSATVTSTLVTGSNIQLPNPLTLVGQVQTTPATTVALYHDTSHDLAYVSGPNGIDIVDVSNPASPVDNGTFGSTQIIQGGLTVGRVINIGGAEYLLVGTTTESNANEFTLLIYSLADPLNPTLTSTTAVPYQFMADMVVSGSLVFVPTEGYSFFFGGFSGQFGNVLSLDVSNPAAPKLDGVLFGSNDPDANTTQYGVTIVNDHIAYVASSTNTGSSTQDGVGRVLVIDYSDPTNLKLVDEVDLPGTYQAIDVSIQGNRALVVARSGGTEDAGVSGNQALAVLDITDPANPQLLGTPLVTQGMFPTGALGFTQISKVSALPLGNGLFAVSEAVVGSTPELLLVDPSDPNNIVVTYSQVPALVDEMAVSGGLLYTSSAQGLAIYNIGNVVSIPVTVSVKVPNSAGLSIIADSFTSQPAQIIPGTDYETLVWNEALAYGDPAPVVSWQSSLSNLSADEVRAATLGATVNFTSQGTAGTFDVPGTSVVAKQIIDLIPDSVTTQPGGTATFDVQLSNPLNSPVMYFVSVPNLDYSRVSQISLGSSYLSGGITVPAGGVVDVPLSITTYTYASLGTLAITVSAQDFDQGANGTSSGVLTIAGIPLLPANPNSYGVVATLTPTQSSTGHNGAAQFTVQVINTGSADDIYFVQADGLPDGVYAQFDANGFDVPPGASNFRDVTMTLSVATGLPSGAYPFTVTVASNDGNSSTTIDGVLNVPANSLLVDFEYPTIGPPGNAFVADVFNAGSETDTYNLTLGGPAGMISTLSAATVTVAAGQSAQVTVTTSSVDFSVPGEMPLVLIATSQTDSNVTASASADVEIPLDQGMTAQFKPATHVLALPGPTSFELLTTNTGNAEGSYTAQIIGTTGLVTASLIGLDGLPTQVIPIFRLPGLATGDIALDATLTAAGQGTVTVRITSLSNPAVSVTTTATVASEIANSNSSTTVVVNSDHASGSVYGQTDEFTALVGASTGTPTGHVQFELDGALFGGPVLLVGGSATITANLSAGTHSVVALYTSDDDRFADGDDADTPFSQLITPAPLTITADNKSKVYGAALPALTASYDGLVNGDAPGSLTTQPMLSTTATVSNPVGTSSIDVGGAVDSNYTISYITGTLTVTPATLTVTAQDKTKVYGAGLPALTASYSGFVNGDTPDDLASPAALVTTAISSSSVANYPITPSGAADPNYAISYVAGTLAVTPASLTITAQDKSKVYGAVVPALTAGYSGLVNGDTPASLTELPALSTAATSRSAVGQYAIIAAGAVDANYTITYVNGTLSVTPASLMITADNKSKVYGAAPPALTASYAGLVNGDTPDSLTTPVALSTAASRSSAVANYPITASGAVDPNYTISYVNGTFAVTPAALTITADSKSKVAGAVNPPLTFTPSGFVNGDTISSLTTPPTLITTATTDSPTGMYPITVAGAVDPNYAISYASGTLTVTPATTATTKIAVCASANPILVGQRVTFTATVKASQGTPTGTISFLDGTTILGTGTLATVHGADVATLSTSSLAVGTHAITVVYAGAGSFAGSTSAVLDEVVNKVTTTTCLSTSCDSPIVGQSVTFTAVVNSSTGVPSGTVTFKDGNNVLGIGVLSLVHGVDQATLSTSSLPAGAHQITAVYTGDVSRSASTSNSIKELVSKPAATCTALASSCIAAVAGQSITFTAVVTASGGTPTGTVNFLDGSTIIGTATLSTLHGHTQATFTTSNLVVGTHWISAAYIGNLAYSGSSSGAVKEIITKAAPTSTSLSSSCTSPTAGQSVTFTAVVNSSGGTPTGTVNFLDGNSVIGTASLGMSHGKFVATFTTSNLGVGIHWISANYTGDSSSSGSTSDSIKETVSKAATTTSLKSSASSATVGQLVTLTAIISSHAGIPVGSVTFLDGKTVLGTVSLTRAGGTAEATLITTSLSTGMHSITALYGGDANDNPSTSTAVSITVKKSTGHSDNSASLSVASSGSAIAVAPSPANAFSVGINNLAKQQTMPTATARPRTARNSTTTAAIDAAHTSSDWSIWFSD